MSRVLNALRRFGPALRPWDCSLFLADPQWVRGRAGQVSSGGSPAAAAGEAASLEVVDPGVS